MTESDIQAAADAYAASGEFSPTADEAVVRLALTHYKNGLRKGSKIQAEADAKSLEIEKELLNSSEGYCGWCPPMLARLAHEMRSSASQLGDNASQLPDDYVDPKDDFKNKYMNVWPKEEQK